MGAPLRSSCTPVRFPLGPPYGGEGRIGAGAQGARVLIRPGWVGGEVGRGEGEGGGQLGGAGRRHMTKVGL